MEDPDCNSPTDTTEGPKPAAPKPANTLKSKSSVRPPRRTSSTGQHDRPRRIARRRTARGGVTHNESLGDASGGNDHGGGLKAPSATGGGAQPLADRRRRRRAVRTAAAPRPPANPTTTIAPFGPAPIGVPNFVIDSFEIPPFLLPIYQACGTEYGIPWEVLAAINKIETGFGTNLNVSSAGAVGWMQFLPSSWEAYRPRRQRRRSQRPLQPGRRDLRRRPLPQGRRRPEGSLRRDPRLQPRRLVRAGGARLRPRLRPHALHLVGSLTGLTEGAHFPVAADARYSDEIAARAALKQLGRRRAARGNAAEVISSSPTRRGINIFAKKGSPVVAVNDGVIRKIGHSPKLGNFIVLEDTFGNRYTYAAARQAGPRPAARSSPREGKEKRLPVESQDLRPRLRALPARRRRRRRRGTRARRRRPKKPTRKPGSPATASEP